MSNHQGVDAQSQGKTGSGERFTFSQLPLAMRRDPVLKPMDLVVVMFILPWMRNRPYGWTTVERIAEGAGISERSVRYSLRRLKKTGWLTAEDSKINPSRREFTAHWLTDHGFDQIAGGLGIDGFTKQVPQLVYSPALSKIPDFAAKLDIASRSFYSSPEYDIMNDSNHKEERRPQSPIGETASRTPDDGEIPETDGKNQPQSAPADPQSLYLHPVEAARNATVIDRGVKALFPDGKPSRVPRGILVGSIGCLARLAARNLDDRHSHDFHCKTLWRVADGVLTPETYLKALETAVGERVDREGKPIRNRGARFIAMIGAMETRRSEDEFEQEWADQHQDPVAEVA